MIEMLRSVVNTLPKIPPANEELNISFILVKKNELVRWSEGKILEITSGKRKKNAVKPMIKVTT